MRRDFIAEAVASIEAEIERLNTARSALLELNPVKGKPGRKKRRTMSAEARARISKAMKLRWAKHNKSLRMVS